MFYYSTMKQLLTLLLVLFTLGLQAQDQIIYDTKLIYQNDKWTISCMCTMEAIFTGSTIIIDDSEISVLKPFDDMNSATTSSWKGIIDDMECEIFLSKDFLMVSLVTKIIKYSR